jgi:hypothetical protein
MKNLIIALSLILGSGILSSCEQNEIFFPECDEEDLGIILSGHTWEVEGSGEIITFNEDGSLEDDDLFFSYESATTKSWSILDNKLFTKATSEGKMYSTLRTILKRGCDRLIFTDVGYTKVTLVKQE